jgi:hypothetical protein
MEIKNIIKILSNIRVSRVLNIKFKMDKSPRWGVKLPHVCDAYITMYITIDLYVYNSR